MDIEAVRSNFEDGEAHPPIPMDGHIADMLASELIAAAAQNRFFSLWRARRFDLHEFMIFCANYYRRVHATTRRVSLALATISDWRSRIELLHNLQDELGHGSLSNVHANVLLRWMEATYVRLGGAGDFHRELTAMPPNEATVAFVVLTEELCLSGPTGAAGAILAQEWHGYDQIAALMDGFYLYRDLFPGTSFHDEAEYFYVHLGRAEKEHKEQALLIAQRHCSDEASGREVRDAFESYMKALVRFWNSLADEVVSAGRTSPTFACARLA